MSWLLLCFVASGMSGLIYEVAWVRSLELIFGATTFAVATVLSAFMGGLALGSFVMGRAAHRFARFHPLAVYAVIEVLIAVCGVLIPLALDACVPVYQAVWRQFHATFVWFSVIRFALCAAILLVPTLLMGATLPVVAAFVGTAQRAGDRRIGQLYTCNTLGAVFGCAAAGLLLFPAVGLAATQGIAIALNVVAAGGAWILLRRHPGRLLAAPAPGVEAAPEGDSGEAAPSGAAAAEPGERSAGSPAAAVPLTRAGVGWLVGLYAVSGFTAMLYEVAWTRVLALVLGSSTYAYTIMLVTFLGGLAGGAYLATRWVGRVSVPLATAGLVQILIAIATFLGVFLVEELPYLYVQVLTTFEVSGRGLLAVQFLLAIVLMILPTLGLGAMFPLTIRGLDRSGGQTARVVGWAYALNTCGAILGSVLAGFLLVPKLGSQLTIYSGVSLNAALGLAALLATPAGSLARFRRVLAIVVVGFIASLFVGGYRWHPHILSSGIFRYAELYKGMSRAKFAEKLRENRGEILMFKEGLTCTVTVCQSGTGVSLLVNGKPDASVPTRFENPYASTGQAAAPLGDLPTQILLGQVPMLLAPQRDQVMVIGLGSGVTLGSVLRHPVQRVECIELEDAVVRSCRFFHQFNGQPLYDKRVELVVNDARNHLLVTEKNYDVIISEPSNPWVAGAASLFTSDFFQLAKTRLTQDGVFCQWIQLYELQVEDFQAILRGFTDAFPQVHLFRVEMDAILVGSRSPAPLNHAELERRFSAGVRADLERIQCRSVEDLLAYYTVGGEELTRHLPPGPRNTDDNMLIEFAAPLRVLSRSDKQQTTYAQHLATMFLRTSTALLPHLQYGDLTPEDLARAWARQADAALAKSRVNEAKLYAERSFELAPSALAARVKGEALAAGGKRDAARAWWQAAETQFPRSPEVLAGTARFFQQERDFSQARDYAERLLDEAPADAAARYLLGVICYQQGDYATAQKALDGLRSSSSGGGRLPAEFAYYLGSLNWKLGRFEQAVELLEAFVQQVPNHLDARYRLGDALMRVGRELEAFHAWQRVAQLRSSAAQIHLQAATGAVRAGDREQARAKLEEAWQFDPTNDEIVFALARLRRQMGDVAGAAGLLENHLRQSAESPWAVSYLAQLSEELGRRDVALLMLQRYQAITGLPWRPVPE